MTRRHCMHALEHSFGLVPLDLEMQRVSYQVEMQTEDIRIGSQATEEIREPCTAHKTHTDGSVHNNSAPWSMATMGLMGDFDGKAAGLGRRVPGTLQSIDRAELLATILAVEGCRNMNLFHTPTQIAGAVHCCQKCAANSNSPNHDLVDGLQCPQRQGQVSIQKMQGTHNRDEAERVAITPNLQPQRG